MFWLITPRWETDEEVKCSPYFLQLSPTPISLMGSLAYCVINSGGNVGTHKK